ncbi:DNA-processing protein DprA [Butyrivibrio sp. MC2021]|uniref:DNA-processing protein DprA n=1 Tax=Butyrivibrio sp. MC2021 TaxID=1408306 RepID=UPI000685EDFE|nr:DNA-processing protein DprA [Butyrivibrio sp. MC2021]
MIKEKNRSVNITENEYAHWLFNIPGVGGKSIDKLLCGGRSCKEVYELEERELMALLDKKQVKSFIESRNVWDFEKEREKLKNLGIRFIPRIDPDFPEKLKNIPDPPFALYVKGELPDENKPSVAIIGARMCSEYGRFMARQLGRGLAMAGVQVISGMARGVDGISQKAALEVGGSSFGIVGNGVDICYPEDNQPLYDSLCENGGVISEYPPGTMPRANFFPMRNRIISGLADVVVVVEARLKSGTQITVDTALEQGREVVALPGRVTDRLSDGCNQLICQGAGMVLGTEDVLEKLFEVRNRCANERNNVKNAEIEGEEPIEMEINDKEITIEDKILENLDIIPTTAANILEGLSRNGVEITIPELMRRLMDMTGSGTIVQEGAYYRKILGGTACAKRFR